MICWAWCQYRNERVPDASESESFVRIPGIVKTGTAQINRKSRQGSEVKEEEK
jgi:hypothetical protein